MYVSMMVVFEECFCLGSGAAADPETCLLDCLCAVFVLEARFFAGVLSS